MSQKATIGRIVTYRTDGRNGIEYDLPAIVNCTRDTHPGPQYPNGKLNPLMIPSSDEHVHLTVFTPGGFGSQVLGEDGLSIPGDDKEWVGATEMKSGSGSYVELNVGYSANPQPRTWRWPTIQ